MIQETPIYSLLVAERGDVILQARAESERIRRDLARVISSGPQPTSAEAMVPRTLGSALS